MIDVIKEEIKLLEKWIEITKDGGWSTHLIKPMRDRVNELKVFLYDYERKNREIIDDSRRW